MLEPTGWRSQGRGPIGGLTSTSFAPRPLWTGRVGDFADLGRGRAGVCDRVDLRLLWRSASRSTFRMLLVLAHDRRKVLHFNATEHPTATWTGQQIAEALP